MLQKDMMIQTETKPQWEVLEREARRGAWKRMFVTLTPAGRLGVCGVTMKALGEPEAFVVLYDRSNRRIGLRPASHDTPHAYPTSKSKRGPGRALFLARLLAEYRIDVPRTIRFPDPVIDDGILTLDLATAKELAVSNKQ